MTSLDRDLTLFCGAAAVVFALLVIVPTAMRRREVFSFWNFFFVGSVLFTGLSGFNAAEQQHYFSYSSDTYTKLYLGILVFYSAFVASYCLWRYPRRLAGRTFRRWAPTNTASLSLMTAVALVLSIFVLNPLPVPLLGQLISQFGMQSAIIGFACAFIAWNRSRANPVSIALLVAAVIAVAVVSLAGGTSRRYLLSALLTVPICIYWMYLRKQSAWISAVWIGISAAAALPVLMGYSAVRHSAYGHEGTALDRATMMLEKLPKAIAAGGSSEGLRGANSIESALATIHLIDSTHFSNIQAETLFSIKYVLANPIPRSMWPSSLGEKPKSLGHELPRAMGLHRAGYVNYGVNVAGQCYYDGGIWVHLLYGLLAGGVFRYFDELLLRKAGNPFVLAILCATCSQVIAWPRGGIEIFSLQIISAFVTTILLATLCRWVFGVAYVDPRTDHVDDPYDVEPAIQQGYWATMTLQQQLARQRHQAME